MFFPRCAAHQPETYRSSRYDISMAWHDQKPETIRFTDHQRNWKKDFPESFKIYGDWMLCEAEDGERAAEIVAKPKGGPADMEMDGRGLPLLPELSTVVGQPSRQATIRKLFNMHYGESHKPGHLGCRKLTLAIARASGTKNQSVPWKTLIADKRKAFTAHVLPNRIALHEPSKMDQDVVENLWSHILELQKNEDPEDQFHFSHFLRGDEWLPARYDAEVAPRQKPGRKRPKTARGPPGLRQLPTADEREQDDNGEEGEDDRDLRGQGGGRGAKATAHRPSTAGPSGKPGARTQRSVPGTSNRCPGHSGTQLGRKDAGVRRAQRPGIASKDKGKARQMDDSSDTSVTPYEDESASSRGEELEHIDITHLNGGDSEDEQSFNTVREGKHSTQTPDYEERVKGVDPVVPPPDRLLQRATNQPPAWVGHEPERVFPFLWQLSLEPTWHELLTSWKHMVSATCMYTASRNSR